VKQGAKTCTRGNVWAGKKISISTPPVWMVQPITGDAYLLPPDVVYTMVKSVKSAKL
jgi:hypothetical protein